MPAVTPLPTPPTITDPENFATRADAFVAALPQFVTEINAIIGQTIPAGSAAAGTLTGDTIAANVVNSSLTSVGTLASLAVTGATTVGGVNVATSTTGTHASIWTWDGSGGSTASLTMNYQKIGDWVMLRIRAISAITGTGSTVLTSATALPAEIRPAAVQEAPCNSITNNGAGVAAAGKFTINTSGIIELRRDNASSTFTNSASAGTQVQTTITYYIG